MLGWASDNAAQVFSFMRKVNQSFNVGDVSLLKPAISKVALAVSLCLTSQVEAANINVNIGCSLANAIRSANTDLAVGGCSAGSLDDVITIPNQTITLNSVDNTDAMIGNNGLPVVTSAITIQGNGTIIERSSAMGTPRFRLLSVSGNSAHLMLDDVTLRYGSTDYSGAAIHISDGATVEVTNSAISQNTASLDGAGIYLNGSNLTLNNTVISQNSATNRAGGLHVYHPAQVNINDSQINSNIAARMSALLIEGDTSQIDAVQVNLNQSQVSNNTATAMTLAKGAIYSYYASLEMTESTLSSNSTTQSGAALHAYQSYVQMDQVQINNNSAASSGGSIYSYYGSLVVKDSNISNNTASQAGGAIYSSGALLSLIGSTISNNSAGTIGGGVAAYSGSLALVTSSVSSNEASTGGGVWASDVPSQIRQSLFSYNVANSAGGLYAAGNAVTSNLSNSTFSTNNVSGSGAAIYVPNGTINIANVTVVNNQASTAGGLYITGSTMLTMSNTVISNNSNGDCNTMLINPPADNWFADDSCSGTADGDPKLGELQDNGGPTLTHAPTFGSGLLGHANPDVCSALPVKGEDQRGAPRGMSECDTGAVEGVVDDSFFVIPLGNGKVVVIPL